MEAVVEVGDTSPHGSHRSPRDPASLDVRLWARLLGATSPRMRVKRRVRLALGSWLLASIMAACGGSDERSTHVLGASSYPRWPAETLVDWVGFADQVSVFEIISERQLRLQPEVQAIDEGYVGREVVGRIESTLWRLDGAPAARNQLSLRVSGWLAHSHELRPIRTRIEVGDRILAAIVKTPEGQRSLLSGGAAIPLAGTTAVPTDAQARSYPDVAVQLRSKSLEQITTLLAATEPSEAALKYAHLDPDTRARAVWNEVLDR